VKKIVLLALANLAFGVQESEFKIYKQILNQLDTKQIPTFVVQTAKPNLPSRVDEMITLKDVSSSGLNIHGEFVLNETKTKRIKGYNKAQILALKDEFYKNGKDPYNRQFINYINLAGGYMAESCEQNGVCGIQTVVEADGSVYPCDFYAMDEYLLGNFNENNMSEIDEKRLEIGSSLSQPELMKVLSILNAASKAITYGLHSEEEDYDVLEEYFRSLDEIKDLKKELSRCIISEEIMADNASPELSHIRRKIKQINSKMHTELNNILNAHREYLMDAVITQRDGAYCLPIKSEYKNKVSGVVHDQSATGSTVFIEPIAVIRMNNELKSLAMDEKKEIEKILENLSLLAAQYIEELRENAKTLIFLDFVYAKANLSKKMNASEPKFNSKHYINIKEGRHPLLDAKKVVPINISLGDTYDLLIITGPNTGGKTVSLKTVGLVTPLGKAGSYLPAL